MANTTKKVFQIVINGLTESVDAVKTLNKELDALSDKIKKLDKSTVKIKVDGGTDNTTKTKVSGNSSTLDAAQKLQIKNEMELIKLDELRTEEGKKQLANAAEIAKEMRQQKQLAKDIAEGAKNIDGTYTDTLAGLRAQIRDMKNLNKTGLLDDAKTVETRKKINALSDILKQVEGEMGQFQSNVGDYENAIKRALQGFDIGPIGDKAVDDIESLRAKLKEATEKIKGLKPGTVDYSEAKKQVDELKKKIEELSNEAIKGSDEIEESLGVRFTTTINGVKYQFDDVNQAVGTLEDKLYNMAQAGDQSSEAFKNIQEEIVRLRKNVVQVDASIDGMVSSSKGLNKAMQLVQGFTGVASLGQGLMGLFGGESEELDETIRKFTALSLVLQGIQTIQEQLNNPTNEFTKLWKQADDTISKAVKSLEGFVMKIPGVEKGVDSIINAFLELEDKVKITEKFNEYFEKMKVAINDASAEAIDKIIDIAASSDELDEKLQDLLNIHDGDTSAVFEDLEKAMFNFNGTAGEATEQAKAFAEAVNQYAETSDEAADEVFEMGSAISQTNGEITSIKEGMAKMANSMNTFGKKAQMGFKAFVTGINAAGKAVKAFAKATVVLLLIQKLTEAVGWVIDKVKEFTGDASRIGDDFNDIANETEVMTNKLNEAINAINNAQVKEGTDKMKQYKDILEQLGETARKSGEELKKLAKLQAEKLDVGKDYADTWGFSTASKDMEEFKKKYQELVNAVNKGQDVATANDKDHGITGMIKSWILTANDAKTDLANMQEAIVRDIADQISKINYNKPAEAFRQYQRIVNDEVKASALRNVDNLFPGQKWAQMLKERLNQFRTFAEQYKAEQEKIQQEFADREAEKAQLRVDIMKDGPGKVNAQAKLDRETAKKEYSEDRELLDLHLKLIEKRRAESLAGMVKKTEKTGKSLADIREQINQNELDAMDEGLEKTLKELELQKQKELKEVREAGALAGELRLSIENKYNKKMLEARRNFYRERSQLLETWHKEGLDRLNQYHNEILSIQKENAEAENEIYTNDAESNKRKKTIDLTYDIRKTGTREGTEEQRKFYDELLDAETKYIERKKTLDKQLEETSYNVETEQLQMELNNRSNELTKFLISEQEKIDQSVKQGLITRQEGDAQLTKLQEETYKQQQDLQAEYYIKIADLYDSHQQKMEAIEREAGEAMVQAADENMQKRLEVYNEHFEAVQTLLERQQKRNRNQMGFINYQREKDTLQRTKQEYKNILDEIAEEYQNLQEKFNNKEISFGEFTEAKKDLDDLTENVHDAAAENEKNLHNLLNNTIKSVLDSIDQYVQAFSEITSQWSELINYQLDAQQTKLDKEAELLDKEYELLDEQYQKQEELTKNHTDKINDIEDELKEARGDRRQHLIAALVAERDERIKSLEKEQEIAKKKEENEKKQKAVEAKQDALEKKRKEEQKRQNIVQATINTYTAVNNALAVQPWFVGLALSAVALSMGLANVAAISKQKYAKGGKLNGNSHAQGGIPVGNTGIEVEGGEYVVNRQSTKYNESLISYINRNQRPITREELIDFYDNGKRMFIHENIGKRYAQGGQLTSNIKGLDIQSLTNYTPPTDNRPIVVSVVDINNAQENLREVRALAGL